MLKRINWRAVLYGFLWAVSLGGLITLMSFIKIEKSALRCKDVKILIPGTQSFIAREELDNIILQTQGPLVGKLLDKINIHRLEKALKANPFIEEAKIYADMDGLIRVRIKQREPVLRVFNNSNQDFYIDRNGFKIPTSSNFTAKVLVASGNIPENFWNKVDTLNTKLVRDLYNAALFIERDTLWTDQVEQLYVNQKNEIEMVPRVGNHRIILGTADSLQIKFRNLLSFYKQAIPAVGWDAYKTINLKYAGQVVCVKNIIDSTALKKQLKADTSNAITVTDTLKTQKNNTTIITSTN